MPKRTIALVIAAVGALLIATGLVKGAVKNRFYCEDMFITGKIYTFKYTGETTLAVEIFADVIANASEWSLGVGSEWLDIEGVDSSYIMEKGTIFEFEVSPAMWLEGYFEYISEQPA